MTRFEAIAVGTTVAAATSTGRPLTRAQKQFNALLVKIEGQRGDLTQWHALVPVFFKRLADDVRPLQKRYRERQIAMAQLLDRALGGSGLKRPHQHRAKEVLLELLHDLLEDGDDEALRRLRDKHADQSFDEAQRRDSRLTPALADDAPRAEVGDEPFEQAPPVTSDAPRPRSAKAIASEAARAHAAQGASHAVREIYRQLVSELHPDREPDAQARIRKTALMQQVNRAYEARDLLVLLELQLSLQQIDPEALAHIAQDRLLHYNALLRAQSQRLAKEIDEVSAPFGAMLDGALPSQGAPAFVLRAIDADVRHLKQAIRAIDDDLARFDDLRQLNASLKHRR